jgi:hypothetical protein
MCAETVCPRCKVLLYTYWVYPSTRYNRARDSLHAVFVSWSNRTVWAFITAILLAVRDRFCGCKFEFTWLIQSIVLRTEALLMVVDHPLLESQRHESSNYKVKSGSGSRSDIQRTSLKTLIAFTVPCLSRPRVSHHLTRLPIYIALVRAMQRVKKK